MTLFGDLRRVDNVAAAFAAVVAERAPRSVALSGGGTAERCYARIATERPDWSDVEVFFGDERFVPVTHGDSNEGMARRVLLEQVGPRAIQSLATAGPTIETAAEAYDATVSSAAPIELVHLGLGSDGHACSLFPGSPALEEHDRLVVPVDDAHHPHPRLTFTYPALRRSRLVVFTVAGPEKRDPLARIRAGEDLPAGRVRAAEVIWLVDPPALGE